jgi:uncharacterized protein
MKKIWLFIGLTFLFSIVFYAILLSAESMHDVGWAVTALMWCPGVSAIITSLIYYKSIKNLGWKPGKIKYLALSFLFPISYSLIPYLIVWISGLGGFDASRFDESWIMFWTLGFIGSCSSALGEEIGWRGFLVPELLKHMSFTKATLITGFIWATWHLPGIIFSDYNSGGGPIYSTLMFFIVVLGVSFVFSWLRVKSGSLWTAMIVHAVHNLFVQGYLDVVTIDTGITKYITGEFGVALAISAALIGFFLWKYQPRTFQTS